MEIAEKQLKDLNCLRISVCVESSNADAQRVKGTGQLNGTTRAGLLARPDRAP